MPSAKVTIQKNFTPAHTTNPTLPERLFLDAESASMFKAAKFDVAFTGIVHLPTSTVYLHPLVATRAGNADMGLMETGDHSARAGILEGRKDTQPILHPNLTPALRATAGLTSGHHQICEKHGFSLDDCVGFAVKKEYGQSTLTTNSRTLNSDKFMVTPRGSEKLPPALKKMFGKPVISDGALSHGWANLIAVTIEVAFLANSVKTPMGNFEAPF